METVFAGLVLPLVLAAVFFYVLYVVMRRAVRDGIHDVQAGPPGQALPEPPPAPQ